MNEIKRYTKKNLNTNNSLIEAKLPPQAIDLEEAILGAVMLESNCLSIVLDILSAESFYKDPHVRIFDAIKRLHSQSYPIDILSVTQELKKTGNLEVCGGVYYITNLTNRVASAGHVEYHARIVQQKYIQRELIRLSTEVINNSYDEGCDIFDNIEFLEKGLTSISKNFVVGKSQEISTLWNKIKEKNSILLNKKGLSGVPSGYYDLDKVTGGFQNSDLIILAARPAMGKTSLAANIARNAAVEFKIPGAIFTLEMSSLQIAIRVFALESYTSIGDFTRRGIEEDRLLMIEKDCTQLINSPLYIDDSEGMTIRDLRSKARKLKREKNIRWIIVDYLQLMAGNGNKTQNREQEISEISRGLKGLAKELEIPVIALSQLSRATETRAGDKRPQLSDLRESGAIEQDADIVMFIHRPEYYGIKDDGNGNSLEGVAEIIFSKHRNGPTGIEQLKFISQLTKFESLKNESFQQPTLMPNQSFLSKTNKLTQEDLPF